MDNRFEIFFFIFLQAFFYRFFLFIPDYFVPVDALFFANPSGQNIPK